MHYTKPPQSISDQVALLISRGLVISDLATAEHFLHHISYYRLRAYTYPFQNNHDSNHPFKTGTTFEEIVETYIFDRKLRLLVFDTIEKVEVALRTQIIYQYAMVYGSHWYENSDLYRDANRQKSDLDILDKEIHRSQEQFIKHYRAKYTHPKRPPSWMALEVTSLGTLSKIYENLRLTNEKKGIAKHFAVGHPFVLESWMHTFSFIRNVCAHHSRLWNRPVITAPKLLDKSTKQWITDADTIDPHKIYATLCCMKYFLNVISPDNTFTHKIKDLFSLYPNIKPVKMGFPSNWDTQALWRN